MLAILSTAIMSEEIDKAEIIGAFNSLKTKLI